MFPVKKKTMADPCYESQDAKRYGGRDELLFGSWRASVISSDIQKFVDKDTMLTYMTTQELGFAGLTHGPPNNKLGMFELYVRGRGITVKNTITPDDTYTKYVLSSNSRSGDKHVFPDMNSLVSYCKLQAMELSNDRDDYETIRELDALRGARSRERDICDKMGDLQLKEKEDRRIRLGGRSASMPPFVDRTTKPRTKRDDLTETGPSAYRNTNPTGKLIPGASYDVPPAAYTGSRAERPPLSNRPPMESGYYLKHGTSGAVKKVEFDEDYGWLSEFY